jgi:hypothetical protein
MNRNIFKAAAKQADDEHAYCAVELKTDIEYLGKATQAALKVAFQAEKSRAEPNAAEAAKAFQSVAAAGIATLRDFGTVDGKSWTGDDSAIAEDVEKEIRRQEISDAEMRDEPPTVSELLARTALAPVNYQLVNNLRSGDEAETLNGVRKVTALALRGLEKLSK